MPHQFMRGATCAPTPLRFVSRAKCHAEELELELELELLFVEWHPAKVRFLDAPTGATYRSVDVGTWPWVPASRLVLLAIGVRLVVQVAASPSPGVLPLQRLRGVATAG